MLSARELMDQLMGKERDVPVDERSGKERHFSDPDICKYFLVLGKSPYGKWSPVVRSGGVPWKTSR